MPGKNSLVGNTCRAAALTFGLIASLANHATAGDWPQILGPARNGIAQGEQLRKSWPAGGPRTAWQYDVGSGYAGVAVAQGRVVVWHRRGDAAIAEALDAKSGQPIWEQKFPTSYQSGIAPDDGPRTVPLVHEGKVYLCSAEGDLHCLRLDSGAVVWSRQAYKDFKTPLGYFGAGSAPIVADGKLLVNIGGPKAGIVAFALADGHTVWQATDEAASYSSPTLATLAGVPQVVFVTRLNVVGIEPAEGKVQFRFPFGMRGPTVNAATPLVLGSELFVTASYGIGAKLARIGKGEPEIVWERDDVMSSQYSTCIAHEGVYYGIDGRQDQGLARLRAFDPQTGKVLWTQEKFGTGNLILADGKLLLMKTDGELVLVEPSAKEFRPLAKAKIFSDTVQPLPAISNGFLYVRNTKLLKALEVGK